MPKHEDQRFFHLEVSAVVGTAIATVAVVLSAVAGTVLPVAVAVILLPVVWRQCSTMARELSL